MSAAWNDFAVELDRWRDGGMHADFWWRDDDAGGPTPLLTRLCALSAESRVPLALAAVPELAETAALQGLADSITIIQHGVDHRNRAMPGEKKNEFAAGEPVEAALRRLAAGRAKLERVTGGHAEAVLAPPWNRLSPALLPHLAAAGYRGLSTFGARKAVTPAAGLVQVNTHVDIIDWKGSRGFCGTEQALGQAIRHLGAKRAGRADAAEATGWLTHHAVHDGACWDFLDQLFEATLDDPVVRWHSCESLFARAR